MFSIMKDNAVMFQVVRSVMTIINVHNAKKDFMHSQEYVILASNHHAQIVQQLNVLVAIVMDIIFLMEFVNLVLLDVKLVTIMKVIYIK